MFHFAGMDQSKVPDAKKSDEEMPEQDKETASPSVDPCSPTAFSSSWAESSLRQGKLVFVPPKRGLPSLNRGYSTPDPSPRCHLPKCGALELMIGAEDDLSDSSGVPRSYGTPRHRIETEPWNMAKKTQEEEPERVRTPSPNLSRIRTPSPLLDRSCAGYEPPPAIPCAPSSVAGMWPLSTCPPLSSSWSGVEWVPPVTPELAPSIGSIVHPYSCNAACKYSGKERGCKDGRNCDHCHLCQWRRTPLEKGPLPIIGLLEAPGQCYNLPNFLTNAAQRKNYRREGSRRERAVGVATMGDEMPRRNWY